MNETKVSDADWWNQRYLQGDSGWDKGRVAPPIQRLISEGVAGRAPVAVLGAGRGHEAAAVARTGLSTIAIDFAEEACRAVREVARQAELPLEALCEDVFALARTHREAFGAVLEHTCFCAIAPGRRAEYAWMVAEILPRGGVFFGLFYAHGRPGGPPFTTSEDEVRRLFSPSFDFERLTRAPDSFPGRAGEELEFVFRRK
jgi:hypothetical protein